MLFDVQHRLAKFFKISAVGGVGLIPIGRSEKKLGRVLIWLAIIDWCFDLLKWQSLQFASSQNRPDGFHAVAANSKEVVVQRGRKVRVTND